MRNYTCLGSLGSGTLLVQSPPVDITANYVSGTAFINFNGSRGYLDLLIGNIEFFADSNLPKNFAGEAAKIVKELTEAQKKLKPHYQELGLDSLFLMCSILQDGRSVLTIPSLKPVKVGGSYGEYIINYYEFLRKISLEEIDNLHSRVLLGHGVSRDVNALEAKLLKLPQIVNDLKLNLAEYKR